jgi:hypothetical protein
MVEAVNLFADVCGKPFFAHSAMILFLNKRDLFQDKIRSVDISTVKYFSDYTGPKYSYDDVRGFVMRMACFDFDELRQGCQYFLDKFLSVNHNPDRNIFHHITCATDTHNISVVWESCKFILLQDQCRDVGFM